LGDTVGDILSKFDPASRRGFNLLIQSLSGVTSSQPNDRNLFFGTDSGSKGSWTDCGRAGNAVFVCALAVHEGELYAGTYEPGPEGIGHVYRYAGGTVWEDCGAPDKCNAVLSLAVHNGNLYAGSARYKAAGSSLAESPNAEPGGTVFRYLGGSQWEHSGKLGDADTVVGMASYQGSLYAIPIYQQGMYRLEEENQKWVFCGTPGKRLMSLGVYRDGLYAAGNEGEKQGGVFRYLGGEQWERRGGQEGVDQVYSFATARGRFYAGTWPEARVFRYDGDFSWSNAGRLGGELEVMAMALYNGKLYAGSLPLAEVYRYEAEDTWTQVGRVDFTPDVRYRRAWSMAVFDGKLFCGTLPSGHIHSFETGTCITHDQTFPGGWRHVAAIREAGVLGLYLDGKKIAASAPQKTGALDLDNNAPLEIGFGQNEPFHGRMRDVRFYRRALNPQEVDTLATAKP
jgi:hypothetical protein